MSILLKRIDEMHLLIRIFAVPYSFFYFIFICYKKQNTKNNSYFKQTDEDNIGNTHSSEKN